MAVLRRYLFGGMFAAAMISIVTRVGAEDLPQEIDLMRDIDEELFRRATITPLSSEELVDYYRLPISPRRRGLDWWVMEQIDGSQSAKFEGYKSPIEGTKVRIFGASEQYILGGSAELSRDVGSEFSLALDVDYRSGRDCSVEGVFSNSFRPNLTANKLFGDGSHLSVSLYAPYVVRGLRSSASQEAISLTGENLYNPSWGLYEGEMRNSRVSRNSVGEFTARYERELGGETKLLVLSEMNYGKRSVSRIGWYDAYNPTPDYYRKLPSYLSSGELQSTVEGLWRSEDLDYTQINWDNLVDMNQLSSDGSAHYTLEREAVRVSEGRFTALFESDFQDGFSFKYGGEVGIMSNRLYKEMEDLLGASYHLDIDQFIGDYAQVGNEMQNDLRNPNREIKEGDRFGYDYTRRSLALAALASVEYSTKRFTAVLSGRFGERQMSRVGHYEKERFSGSESYGESERVSMSESSVDLTASYNLGGGHQMTLRGGVQALPISHDDLFIQEESSNRMIDDASSRSIKHITVGYQYTMGGLRLRGEAYYLGSQGGVETWSGYDDISSSYTNIVVSGITQRSIGIEMSCSYRATKRVKLDLGVTAGDYMYTSAPIVTLYEDTDMTLLSRSSGVSVEGCKVGNAPQVVVMCGADLFLRRGLILSVNGSHSSGRYISPSFVRRTERVLASTKSSELSEAIITQESLGSMLDLRIGITKLYYYSGGRRMTIHVAVDNALGDRDRVEYGYEGGRLLRGDASYTTGSYYLQSSKYSYGVGRTMYISASYSW